MEAGGQSRSAAMQQSMEEVVASVQRALALLHQLHSSVSNFSLSSQLLLLERLNGVLKELTVLQSTSQNLNVPIPLEVVRFIDEGRNPDEFTKDLLNHCTLRNQFTKGKVDSFKNLRRHMLEELEDTFPEETEAYRAIRTQAAAENRRAMQAPGMLSNGDVKVKTEH
ncbi:hypothetical protein R1sor_017050 [Riccia sorocarpa]|uniref:Mediator of RNA polymerase II transcription subunit 10 n=1 Tax=Riccia sorocarpa TaxID=122646 RepID=A0ABD3I5Q1_9MARC